MSDALAEVKERTRRTHKQVLGAVEALTDEQLAWRPSAGAHSIGWTLWHIARCADRFASEVSPRAEIWMKDDLARRWGLDVALMGSNGAGTGISDDAATHLRAPRKDDLLDYTRRALAAADAVVDELDASALAREYDSALLERHTNVADGLFVTLTHGNRHLGEIEYIKGLIGLRGSVTR